ncbi:MAG: glycine/sarcosine/betaine reductase selenoprotein B family protein [Planctomycetota bacterium]|nr:glycine/sarcosine/betaine reductase selenoprotein B family protein [Planctomycetota bacterium]
MARLCDLPSHYERMMRERDYPRFDWGDGAKLSKPLSECRISVVTTAAYHLSSQAPFETHSGSSDCSFRELPVNTAVQDLKISHKSDAFDVAALAEDKEIALPLSCLKELAMEGEIGSLGPRHISFMGSLRDPEDLFQVYGPLLIDVLREDAIDAVLLTPV